MKKLLGTLALSLSALIATSAMAAPQHDPRFSQNHNKPTPPAHWNQKDAKKWDQKDAKKWEQEKRHQANRFDDRRLNPSRDWRSGDKLPAQFDNHRYRLNNHESRHLPKAKNNQNWYKVNGDYVLVNERNNKIVRVMG